MYKTKSNGALFRHGVGEMNEQKIHEEKYLT